MATKLEKPLKREVQIGEQPYMLTISPEGLKLVPKGKRNGLELAWKALISGEAALASALNASVQENAKNAGILGVLKQTAQRIVRPSQIARSVTCTRKVRRQLLNDRQELADHLFGFLGPPQRLQALA